MKRFVAALLLASTSLLAQELDATDALLSTLAAGNYSGLSSKGNICSISVINLSNRIAVVAAEGGLTTRSEVFQGSSYRWRPAKREFLASVLTTTLTDKRENFVRTIAIEENSQYVAVGDIITSAQGTRERVIECNINF